MNKIRELIRYRQMLKSLVISDLRTRYKGSILGFLWTFLNPLLMLLVYSTIFSTIMRIDIDNYAMFLFIGLLPWLYFQTSLISSSSVLIRNSNLIKKIYFPREVLPLSVVFGSMINFIFGLFILIPALYISGMHIAGTAIYFPLILLVQTILTISIVVLISVVTVYFRDLEHILGILLMAWFYFTPIIFPTSFIPAEFLYLFELNPMKPIIEAYQAIFYYYKAPDIEVLSWTCLYSGLFLIVSSIIFKQLNKRVAEEI